MLTTFIIIVVFIFLFFVSLLFLIAWQSLRDSNILGGVVLMWIFLIIFLLAFIFSGRNREVTEPAKTGFVPYQTISVV